jgi:Putative zinc-finger
MKCEVCLELLEEYLDGEVPAEDQEQISEHLITCADCSTAFGTLTAEQALFARYDREIEVPPFLWTRVAEHCNTNTSARRGWRVLFGPLCNAPAVALAAIAIPLLGIAIGIVRYTAFPPAKENTTATSNKPHTVVQPKSGNDQQAAPKPSEEPKIIAVKTPAKRRIRPAIKNATVDQSDVWSSDLGYMDIDEQDTARHIEQTQNLLRSIKNVSVSDGDEEIDVSYDKALSRRLLNENVVLRRDAEMKAKFPTKTLLADLEPFLIDIANLPDHARPEDVRVIKERVQKTEIVAALVDYQDRGRNNRE